MRKDSLNFETLRKGDILSGRVESITAHGIFVRLLNSQVGLIHKEDVSSIKGNYPIEDFIIADTINVKIKSYDRNTGKISLTYKELLDSWSDSAEKISEGDVLNGIVRNHHENSVFIEVKPNFVGLANYKSGISYGDKVSVIVKKIMPENKKMKLEIL